MSSQILMLRHGITEGNKNKWFYGAVDLPLLPEGREALSRQRSEGLYPPVPKNTCYYTTGLGRTRETLEVLFGNQEFHVIKNLREMEFGIYECKSFDDLKKDEGFQAWLDDEEGDLVLPGGESRNHFNERVIKGTDELVSMHQMNMLAHRHSGEDVMSVLVSHGGVICAMMEYWFPGEKENMWEWMIKPGSGYLVHMDPKDFNKKTPIQYVQIGETMVY